ncbi:response regulator [bacterium]|nr:response regulator [bacterium]
MLTIVVCSPSAILRRNLTASLERHGHRVLNTDSSISLVSACLTRTVDLALIDSGLEYLSTIDAIRCLKCTRATYQIPLVAMVHDASQLQAFVKAGASHAVTKPVEITKLISWVEHQQLKQARA